MKQISLSTIIIICLIVFIPVTIGTVSLQIMHNKPASPSSDTQTYVSLDNSTVTYNQKDVNKLQEIEKNRPELTPTDAMAKVNLIKRGSSLAITQDYAITYNQATDIFQAEITTISYTTAKKEVVEWFKDQGMSAEGLCQLPLGFTLEPSVANSLKGLDIIFNPLPPGC